MEKTKQQKKLRFCLLLAEIDILLECISEMYELDHSLCNPTIVLISQKLDKRLNMLVQVSGGKG